MWVRQGDAVLVGGQQWEEPREGRREESLWEGGHVVAGGDDPEEQSSGEGQCWSPAELTWSAGWPLRALRVRARGKRQ